MKHLLVVRFSAFGDVAMTIPVIRSFLAQNPDVSITYISQSHLADLFKDIDRLTFIPAHLHGEHSGVKGLRKLWNEANREHRHDAFIDLHSVLRTFILKAFARMSFMPVYSMRKNRHARSLLVKGTADKRPLRVIPELYADVFRRSGYSVRIDRVQGVKKQPFLSSVTQKTGFSPHGKSVGIAPFSQYEGKTYPPERMKSIIGTLAANPSLQIVLMGGRGDEAAVLEQWAAPYPNVICAAGRLSLSEELSLLSSLDLMVSMDSANMHLCSMVGTRVVSVWGATHHFAGFLGYGQSVEDVVEADDMSCRPCSIFGSKPCRFGTYACMNSIDEKTIVGKIYSCIGE